MECFLYSVFLDAEGFGFKVTKDITLSLRTLVCRCIGLQWKKTPLRNGLLI